jgi:hypothetical protein
MASETAIRPSARRIDSARERAEPRWIPAAFAAMALASGVLVMWMTRRVTFVNDEWDWIGERYQGGLASLLRDHNEQLLAAPLLVYKVLLHTVGLEHHWPYTLVWVIAHLLCVTLAFVLVRARLGGIAALIAVAPLLVLGSSWETVLWPPAAMTFVPVTAGLLAAWWALDRGPGPRNDVLACLALLVATASSSACVPLLLAVALELVLAGRRRALWIPAVPLAAFGAWYVGYGSSGDASLDTVARTPQWVAEVAGITLAGLFGQRGSLGPPLLVLGVALLAVAATRRTLSPRLVGALVAVVGFWLLIGAARATTDGVGNVVRFVYPGAVLLVVAGAEALRGVRVAGRVAGVGAVLSAIAVAGNLGLLREGQRGLEDTSSTLRAEVGALELQAAAAPPAYSPSPGLAPIEAEAYLRTMRLTGSSPALDPSELPGAPAQARAEADRVLRELAVRTGPPQTPSAAAPRVAAATGTRVRPRGACTEVTPSTAGAPATATLARAGITVRASRDAGVEVRLRRFADTAPAQPSASVPPGTGQSIRVNPDAATVAWRAELASAAAFAVCSN